MVENAKSLGTERVHLIEAHFVLSFFVTIAANVEIFVEQLFAAVAMHVNVRQLFHAKLAEEVPCAVRVQ